MPVVDRIAETKDHRTAIRLSAAALGLSAVILIGLALGSAGCMTRSESPVWGPDSTLVYPSRMANDVNASITFQLRDSALRDAAKKSDRTRAREISRLQKGRDKLISLQMQRERDRKEAEAKKKVEARKKSSKRGKGGKKGVAKPSAEPARKDPRPVESVSPGLSDAALRDSIAVIDARLATLLVEDSLAALVPWRIRDAEGRQVEERVFDIEEGARVLATVDLTNVYARGRRPLMFHLVWLNPERKRVFKRMIEYVPNDTTQSLTTSLTITPTKRSAGHYSLQVFLFREQIAEKSFRLQGQGMEEELKGGGDAM